MVPDSRVRAVNEAAIQPNRPVVLYWMIAARRTTANYGLEHAVARARTLGKPLVVFEALRAAHPWACDRFHQFVLDGMHDNAEALSGVHGVTYFPYLEPRAGHGRGLLEALAAHAAVVVTDDTPTFFLPRMVAAAGERLDTRLEAVDSDGLLPLRTFDRAFPTAHAFRRGWQQVLAEHLPARPAREPLNVPLPGTAWPIPAEIHGRWPDVFAWLEAGHTIAGLPIDHAVKAAAVRGGPRAANDRLDAFANEDLQPYAAQRNDPDRDASSRLSPYLHWGHIGAHEVFDRIMTRAGWLGHVPARPTGSREGWWATTWRRIVLTTTTASSRCRTGLDRRWNAMATIPATRCTSTTPSSEPGPTTRSGTPPSASSWRRDAFTTTCACCGQEDPAVVGDCTPCAGRDDSPEQQVRDRRTRPELLRRHLLGAGAVRPSVGAGTLDSGSGPLHDIRKRRPEAAREAGTWPGGKLTPMRIHVLAFGMLASVAAALPAHAQVTAFVGGRVIDGTGKVIDRGTVVVRDGRIVQVGPQGSITVPAGATQVDVAGKTLMPGIINAHGHLAATSGLRSAPELYTRENLVRQLQTYAQYGVTTVYSLGDDQAAGFALRDESAARPP